MARLKIDLRQGVLEVEGEESFISTIYQEFRSRSGDVEIAPLPDENAGGENGGRQRKRKSGSNSSKESYEINKDLDLYGKAGHQPLQDFYESVSPSSALERNTVFVYYLKKILKKEGANLSDVYTCYKALDGVPFPAALKQSVYDTSGSRYGWIDASNMDDLRIPLKGEQFVEQHLTARRKSDQSATASKKAGAA